MVKKIFLIGAFLLALVFRFPNAQNSSLLIASLIPVLVFLVGRKLFDRNTAIVATLFTIFSYVEIVWTKQASQLILLQLIILISIWIYAGLVKKFSIPWLSVLVVFIVIGWLTHVSYAFFLIALFFHFIYLCFHWNFFNKKDLFRFLPYIIFFIILIVLLVLNTRQALGESTKQVIQFHPNNTGYYHNFLWKEQSIITFLAGVGIMLNALKYRKGTFLVLVPILCYLIFLFFFWVPLFSYNILPIFPLILILAGFAISTITSALNPRLSLVLALVVTFFLIVNGDTFVVIPKQLQPSRDMTEIAVSFD